MIMPTFKRVDCLDGLRGIAALWVLVGHAMLLTGAKVPVLSDPDLGVDLFVMLSGFLMVFHFYLRADSEPWEKPSTWIAFWARRFFRIAPLYYVALAAALILGGWVYDSRMVIDAALSAPPQASERYLDHSLGNVLMHVSFLFGLVPHFAFRTALPDWSLGLEMQFYAVFPAIMLFIRWVGWIRGTIALGLGAFGIAVALKLAGIEYPMPAFLPLKLNIFLGGMLLGSAVQAGARPRLYLVVAAVMVSLPAAGLAIDKIALRIIIVAVLFWLVSPPNLLPRRAPNSEGVSKILGSRPFHWLGELSFGVYLFHLVIMQPVAAFAWSQMPGTEESLSRLLLVLGLTAPPTYLASWLGYWAFERTGQNVGRSVLKRWMGRSHAGSTKPEIIAAP